jgi:hypothetical protein
MWVSESVACVGIFALSAALLALFLLCPRRGEHALHYLQLIFRRPEKVPAIANNEDEISKMNSIHHSRPLAANPACTACRQTDQQETIHLLSRTCTLVHVHTCVRVYANAYPYPYI